MNTTKNMNKFGDIYRALPMCIGGSLKENELKNWLINNYRVNIAYNYAHNQYSERYTEEYQARHGWMI